VEFHILGPLEVADGDRAISLEAPKQRALLSVLLLHPNEVVSSARLIDELWGERPPATATKVVQTYVSQLRRVLGPGVIATRPPGYMLRVQEDALDAERFRRLTAEARRLAANGEQERAGVLFREALLLWRGPPLADVVFESFARNEVEQLEEERLGALMDRIDCELALGHHEGLAGELETFVKRYPLRERLRAQLMLALYRSGRQADALATYQDARRALVGELGLEPSRELQALEGAILNQDPALAATPRLPPLAPNLPATTETGTIAVADIEAFTPLIRELTTDEFRALVAELHRIMQTTLEEAGGQGVILLGDGAMGVFRSASAAVAASLRLQEAIASHRWPGGRTLRVNIALHSGEVVATAYGSFGVAVNQTWAVVDSKVLRGGRILVSETTRGLLDSGDLVLRPRADVATIPFSLFELISDRSVEDMVATLSNEVDMR
jgi:DNA-binding SARP family transcriptional activator